MTNTDDDMCVCAYFRTVESVIDSDDEDSLEFNLKQLAKVNKKNDSKAKQSKVSKY